MMFERDKIPLPYNIAYSNVLSRTPPMFNAEGRLVSPHSIAMHHR